MNESIKFAEVPTIYDFSAIAKNKMSWFHQFFKCNFLSPKCANNPISYTTTPLSTTFHHLLPTFTGVLY